NARELERGTNCSELSSMFVVENGTPQGSVVSPTFFSIMINDDAVTLVEEWGTQWGFKFSVEKTKTMFFTKKKLHGFNLTLYGNNLERVDNFFLGVYFDTRLTWKEHVRHVVSKGKKVINLKYLDFY
uniref:Reverse transcriptase n=1 Tax=Sander lucioperca TaxID=283035 RepID=A0A8C9Z6A4_SANLU